MATYRRAWNSRYRETFFGLNSQYREYLFTQIHEIIFWGKGGYDWNTIYNMPIWLRRFTFHKIKDFHDQQNTPENTVTNSKEILKPDISEGFTYKSSL